MKIVTICGMGLGTSLMLKMYIEQVLRKRGQKAEISNIDLGSIKSANADLIIAPKEMMSQIKDVTVDKIFINNLINKKELEEKLEDYLNNLKK
ncbi:PTS sugar transporter subunit IIB [Thermoanaerobacterium sp. DL9XJH110]|uniref:PTS sugar transporter subunit IIB n=1 Tax=Thermoanaerobacterium sp. DL9XJH110 TaxID=3386643 RepID=UPI003BB68B60